MPPRNRPIATSMLKRSKPSVSTASANVKNKARAVTAAEAIAKPFATAAVVFPSASSWSVASRTSGGSSAISAIPPALSAIGP